MRRNVFGNVVAAACILLLVVTTGGTAAADEEEHPDASPLVCDAYAGDPAPGTDAWFERDRNNLACSNQRQTDILQNPAFFTKWAVATQDAWSRSPERLTEWAGEPDRVRVNCCSTPQAKVTDPFRTPEEWAASGRGRHQRFGFFACSGAKLNARLYSPNIDDGDERYPGITFEPGLQSYNEVNSWFGQGLAEAGYIVLIIDPQGQGDSENQGHSPATCSGGNTSSAISFLRSTPATPHPGGTNQSAQGILRHNPEWSRLDPERIGIAGHSLGAIAVTPLGQTDERVSAVVSYDNLDGTLGSGVPRRTPSLFFYTDYPFPAFGTPRASPPDASQHLGVFNQLDGAGVDVMSITTRASTHYEWGYQPFPTSFPASRYGERVSFHYTLAWFDRYLKDDRTAITRLTSRHFDGSSDRHSIGTGTFDPELLAADPTTPGAGNSPYRIADACAANLMSFYYRSAYRLEGGELTSSDMRAEGCARDADPDPDPLEVTIDVKPGSETNPINTRSKGGVPVAIVSTDDYDGVARTDPASLTFGKTGSEESLRYADGVPDCSVEDVDADGRDDLLCTFATQELGYTGDEGTTAAVLKGVTTDVRPVAIRGEDSVRIG